MCYLGHKNQSTYKLNKRMKSYGLMNQKNLCLMSHMNLWTYGLMGLWTYELLIICFYKANPYILNFGSKQ
jgi:hypothetical protein